MNKTVKNYAKSFFDKLLNDNKSEKSALEIEKKINLSLEDLALFSSTILSSKKLYSFFHNPFCEEQKKYEVLVTLFPKITENSHSLLSLLVEKREIHLLPLIFNEYRKISEKFNKVKKVKIITASYFEQNMGSDLLKQLKKISRAKEIILEVEYKEELLSGVILEFDSTSIDASLVEEFKGLLKET